jgi:hypothetical protein
MRWYSVLSRTLISAGIFYFTLNAVLFFALAPRKISLLGIQITLETLDKPIVLSCVLILFGLLARYTTVRSRSSGHRETAAVLFCLVMIFHLASGVTTSFDSRWVIPTAKSMVSRGDTDLNEYKDQIEKDDYRIERIKGHLYSIFPVGVPLLAAPFVLPANSSIVDQYYADLEKTIAVFMVALTAVFLYLASLTLLRSKYALSLALIFAFGTSAWSTASRGLWQHAPSMLMLTLALYLLLKAEQRPVLAAWAGLPLGLSYMIRPTNIIPVIFLSLYVLIRYRKFFMGYLLRAAPAAVLFLLYNFLTYGAPLSSYYLPQGFSSLPGFFEALVGHLVSPARGLFIYSPLFLFSIFGLCLLARSRRAGLLDYLLMGCAAGHLILISSFPHWWGGHSYGPRMSADMIPFLCYFIIPVFSLFSSKGIKRRVFVALFVVCLGISFIMNFIGAVSYKGHEWNDLPADVDQAPSRLWDWSDPPFLRPFREFKTEQNSDNR